MQKDQNKKLIMYSLGFVTVVAIFLLGVFLGQSQSSTKDLIANTNNTGTYELTGDLKSEFQQVNVNLLWETWSILEKEYINNDLDGQKLLYGAAKGLVDGLGDPYTSFLTPEETEGYLNSNKGEFEGIGATLKQEEEYVAVESPIENSPAKNAGLIAGDLILTVDGEDAKGKSVYEVAASIRGVAGTNVKLALFRPSSSEKYEVNITRAKIDLDNVTVEKVNEDIMKITISKFTEENIDIFNEQWDSAVAEVQKENPKGVIIDLRNNPGGFVSAVEYVLGEFFPKGTVIFSEQDKTGNKTDYRINRKGEFIDMPMVVLVNSGSASASEIFAGAVQDHDRGLIIGEKTVGKGVEQRLITLSDGSMMNVVFQKWLTPSGLNITKDAPISPDVSESKYDEQDLIAIKELSAKF